MTVTPLGRVAAAVVMCLIAAATVVSLTRSDAATPRATATQDAGLPGVAAAAPDVAERSTPSPTPSAEETPAPAPSPTPTKTASKAATEAPAKPATSKPATTKPTSGTPSTSAPSPTPTPTRRPSLLEILLGGG